MFFACWEAVLGTLRKEIFAYVNSTMTGLQFICVTTSYTINFEDKKTEICPRWYNQAKSYKLTLN